MAGAPTLNAPVRVLVALERAARKLADRTFREALRAGAEVPEAWPFSAQDVRHTTEMRLLVALNQLELDAAVAYVQAVAWCRWAELAARRGLRVDEGPVRLAIVRATTVERGDTNCCAEPDEATRAALKKLAKRSAEALFHSWGDGERPLEWPGSASALVQWNGLRPWIAGSKLRAEDAAKYMASEAAAHWRELRRTA